MREDGQAAARVRSDGGLGSLARLAGLALLVVWAIVNLGVVGSQLRSQGQKEVVDFFTFLVSADEWRAGRDPYAAIRTVPGPDDTLVPVHPNLNHPVMIPLFAPLTGLSPAAAYSLWSALGVLAWVAAVVLAMRVASARANFGEWLAVAALAAVLPGAIYGLQLGQVALPLALVTVGCWAGLRRAVGSRVALAGAAGLGALVALKPFFFPLLLIFLPRRDWRGVIAAGLGGVGISLAAVPLLGFGSFRTWIALGGAVDWHDHGLNIGLAGVLWRVAPSPPPTIVTWGIAAVVALAAAATLRVPVPPGLGRVDRDLGVLLIASLLGSPLGWQYYTPLLLPAFAALFAARRALAPLTRCLALAACGLIWMPHILLPVFPDGVWSELTLRATATWGLVVLWVALGVAGRVGRAVEGVVGAGGPRAEALG